MSSPGNFNSPPLMWMYPRRDRKFYIARTCWEWAVFFFQKRYGKSGRDRIADFNISWYVVDCSASPPSPATHALVPWSVSISYPISFRTSHSWRCLSLLTLSVVSMVCSKKRKLWGCSVWCECGCCVRHDFSIFCVVVQRSIIIDLCGGSQPSIHLPRGEGTKRGGGGKEGT